MDGWMMRILVNECRSLQRRNRHRPLPLEEGVEASSAMQPPDVGLREALRLLPFASMLDAPLRILIGAVDVGAALRVVGLQLFWLAVLAALGRAVVGAGARKCMVQGG